jgi:hypothetical protein
MTFFYDYLKIGDCRFPVYTDDKMHSDEIAIANWQGKILNKVKIRIVSDARNVYNLTKELVFTDGSHVSGARVFIVQEGKVRVEFKAYYDRTIEIQDELRSKAPIGTEYIVVYKGKTRCPMGYCYQVYKDPSIVDSACSVDNDD